ncbi:MAG TPA: tetratricopeptide repeat protein [Gammaproteobacteria bacterium]|nr:tetratricopeptide repeat protein [Gammaproteobacteria bacterium]
MSKPFADRSRHSLKRGGVTAACAFLLAACGASTPKQAAVERPTAVTAEPARAAPAAAVAQNESAAKAANAHGDGARKRERRGDRAPAQEPAPAVEAIPEAAAATYARALGAMREQNWLQAEIELQQLTAEYPAYAGPHVNLAIVYLHDKRLDDARAALDRALAIDPGHAAANTQLGILLREQGKFQEAEQAYRKALATDPNHALAHYNLGVLLDIYLRRPAEALEQYELYQGSLAAPDESVGRWIVDLRRRTGNANGNDAARVAKGDAP